MQVRVKENVEDIGRCGCGRSPDGYCCGWHGLTEQEYRHKQMLYIEEQLARDIELEEIKKQSKE
jgi:hypothetical protein